MTDSTPELCCTHGQKLDRILELLEDRKARRGPADGAYRVRIPESSQIAAYWVQRQIDEQRAADERDVNPEREVENQEPPKYATGGFVEAPEGYEPPIIQRGCVIDESYLFTKDHPFLASGRLYLDRWVKANEGDDQ